MNKSSGMSDAEHTAHRIWRPCSSGRPLRLVATGVDHITARCPNNPNHLLINPMGARWDEMTASLLAKVNVDGNTVEVHDDKMLMATLFHDVGDLSMANHAEVAAAILKPYVRPEIFWIVKHHETFRAHYYGYFFGDDRNMRDRYRGHPYFEATVRFCEEWDDPVFNPKLKAMPLSAFEQIARRVFEMSKRDV